MRALVRRGGAAATGECYEGLVRPPAPLARARPSSLAPALTVSTITLPPQACYRPAFYVTTTACTLALGLSLFAGWRRERAGRDREKARQALGV